MNSLVLLLAVARLVTIDPGHFHASLVQNRAYPEIDRVAKVFAPDGPELDAHLKLVDAFNARKENPTSWQEEVCKGPDYLARFAAAAGRGDFGPQPIVILAGRNDRKGDYALKAVECGCNVLSDKPMAITPEVFAQTERAARLAQTKGLLFADIMTERNEITTILQRELTLDRKLYGEQERGTPEDPAVTKVSVHHFCKLVNGTPLRRPEWFYDVSKQGEGIADITTHLVDMVQWETFPGVRLQTNDVRMISARTWPTRITPEQFKLSTGGVLVQPLDYRSNGEFTWALKGVHCKVSVTWAFMAPEGTGDTHYSLMRGTKAEVFIRQGKPNEELRMKNEELARADEKSGNRPKLYVRSRGDPKETERALNAACARIAKVWTGVRAEPTQQVGTWRIVYPVKYDIGHEAHFSEVVRMFLGWMKRGREDSLYIDNMLVKYYTIVEAWKLAHREK